MGCGATAYFLHCFWTCLLVHTFWIEIDTFISSTLGLSKILHPKNCLVGVLGDIFISKYATCLLWTVCNGEHSTDMKGTLFPIS